MNATAWNLLAECSRALVHHASLLMGALTQPPQAGDDARAPVAARALLASHALLATLSLAPELAAHQRVVQRFEAALVAWQRSVGEHSPIEQRYQTALLQQAAQVLISCLHVEALAESECARVNAAPFELVGRAVHPAA